MSSHGLSNHVCRIVFTFIYIVYLSYCFQSEYVYSICMLMP